jgi:tRNA threonylcarbamoyladenosine biosynthesis protein TsaB
MQVADGAPVDRFAGEIVGTRVGEIEIHAIPFGSDLDEVEVGMRIQIGGPLFKFSRRCRRSIAADAMSGSRAAGPGCGLRLSLRVGETGMRVLAFDTASSGCSAAAWTDGRIRARRCEAMTRGQSEALLPMVLETLAAADWRFSDVELFAVTVGPGAFTGIRIGLAAARAFSLASGRPCLGVSTLEAVAEGVPQEERASGHVLVALETKRADLYAQVFDGTLRPLGAACAVPPEDLAKLVPTAGPVVIAGDGADRALEALAAEGAAARLSAAPASPDAALVANLAGRRWRPGTALRPPSPLYLRPPDVTLSAGSGPLRQ